MLRRLKRDKLRLKDSIASLERRLMQEKMAQHDSPRLGAGGFGKVMSGLMESCHVCNAPVLYHNIAKTTVSFHKEIITW
jgi:hypothetical protein